MRKFGHTKGVLKRKLIQIADFKIRTVLDWENPGYGDVAAATMQRLEVNTTPGLSSIDV